MKARVTTITLLSLLALSIAASSAAAHNTVYSPDNNIRFTYGHLGEPVYTFQKTGLDLTLRDNATGAVLPGYEVSEDGTPKLFVSYRYGAAGGQELNITDKFVAQHNAPGKYTYPIVFTRPGLYSLLVKGVINGTYYDMVIPPAHEVPALDTIMWPDKVDTSEAMEQRIANLEAEVDTLQSQKRGTAPGLDALIIVAVLGAVVLLARRRL